MTLCKPLSQPPVPRLLAGVHETGMKQIGRIPTRTELTLATAFNELN
jgi:hypothetical protein